jgi:large subunit ribosomal protein L37Ae
MAKKKKVGSAGRYGPRYGKRLKRLVSDVEKVKRSRHVCPKCKMRYVRRVTSGVWQCKKCGAKFAGASYKPKSD